MADVDPRIEWIVRTVLAARERGQGADERGDHGRG